MARGGLRPRPPRVCSGSSPMRPYPLLLLAAALAGAARDTHEALVAEAETKTGERGVGVAQPVERDALE